MNKTEISKTLMNEFPYKVLAKDIKWTKRFLNKLESDRKRKQPDIPTFAWISNACTVEIDNKNKKAVLIEIDLASGTNPLQPYQETSNILSVLNKIGYSIHDNDKVLMNTSENGRVILNGEVIPHDAAPQATYDGKLNYEVRT